jgi:hypothetical protein
MRFVDCPVKAINLSCYVEYCHEIYLLPFPLFLDRRQHQQVLAKLSSCRKTFLKVVTLATQSSYTLGYTWGSFASFFCRPCWLPGYVVRFHRDNIASRFVCRSVKESAQAAEGPPDRLRGAGDPTLTETLPPLERLDTIPRMYHHTMLWTL